MRSVRCVVADDSVLIRSGVAALLDGVPDVALVESVATIDDLFDAVARHTPDIAIVDIRMPPTFTDEGIQAAERLRATCPGLGVLVLSQMADSTLARRLLAAGHDRRGYLLKDSLITEGELERAVRFVADGGSYLDPTVLALLAEQTPLPETPLSQLSKREREILAAVAEGLSNQSIGNTLFISHRAVEKHINSIFTKLNLHDDASANRRVQAVLLFLDGSPR